MDFTRSDFPEGFVFGTATSAYQIEGHAHGGAGLTHWDTFAATPGNVVRGENGAIATDHYHRYPQDLDLARAGGFDAYRFSMSWARLLPDGRGAPNAEGLAFYDRLLDAMLERGLKPFPTLYHWELPVALADLGGWRNRDIAAWFGDYADLIARHYGDRIHAAAPINEPWCVAWLSHFMGHHAPGLRDIRAAARAMHHVLLAHGTAIQAMRARGMDTLGLVVNFEHATPADDSDAARAATARYDAIYNRWFLEGVFKGAYPAEALEGLAPHMPSGWEDDFATIMAPLDWVGINYYTRKLIAPDPGGLFPAAIEVDGPLPKTTMGWEIYPEGLAHFIDRVGETTANALPIYITENGLSADDVRTGAGVSDPHRIDFLNRHLAEVRRTIAEGRPVRGYFIWSLMDNFEWALGYEKRFGLVHVDFDTLDRTPKESLHSLSHALGGTL